MNKYLKISKKRINLIFKTIELVIAYVNKTNDRLYKGIDNAKVTMDVTVKQIHQAQNKVTEISDSIFEHEQEIKKNQALIDKLVKFTGGNE